MKNPKINYQEYEMENGEYITMSTAPILLLGLRNKNKAAYAKLSRFMTIGDIEEDVVGMYEFLYNTYLNANQDEDNTMTFAEFIENANQDYSYNAGLIGEMLKPTKKQDSEQPSNEQ